MKNSYSKINQSKLSLGDLISTVSSCARNQRETIAALLDLFESGRVQIKRRGTLKRIRLSAA